VLRTISAVPLAIALASALDSPVRPANAFVGPTMPPVPLADAMVALALSPVQVRISFVAHHVSSNGRLPPSVHVLAHPMRSPLPPPIDFSRTHQFAPEGLRRRLHGGLLRLLRRTCLRRMDWSTVDRLGHAGV
jgi:hypothetical protein